MLARVSEKLPPLVLVVDDYDDSREMCAEFLTFSGFRVEEARDGNEALAKATALIPDVILMDISLPGIDGWEATRRLKSEPKTRGIRILALTGFALRDHEAQATSSGCDGFVTKPCTPDQMVEAVRRQIAVRDGGP